MKVKIKNGEKFVMVKVLDRDCPKRTCFRYGYYTHHNAAGYSGCFSRTDNSLSCLYRDNFGCPDDR